MGAMARMHFSNYPYHKPIHAMKGIKIMKNLKKAIALCLSLMLILTFPVGASAAPVADATIDTDAKASLTVFKYDISATRS